LERLQRSTKRFHHLPVDIRDRDRVMDLFAKNPFELVIHCAAQPSHDKAKDIPILDFEVNALGTLHLLEATRQHSPDAVFCHMSTNKVYGDAPNELPLQELETRWEYARPEDWHGISEQCRIDQTTHSLFGASKASADIVAQEYGRYFGMKVGVFRGGCLTGASHSGVELHGFLSYLVHVAVTGKPYTIFGYQGKQVRDQIESRDVIAAFAEFASQPRPGEVYNLGGGRENSASVLESIQIIERLSGYRVRYTLNDTHRVGDHICYISDLRRLKSHYPNWSVKTDLETMIGMMIEMEEHKQKAPAAV
jgi:CDP-paratose 2-epimerase